MPSDVPYVVKGFVIKIIILGIIVSLVTAVFANDAIQLLQKLLVFVGIGL